MVKRLNSFLDALIFLCFLLFSLILAFGQGFSSALIDGINLYLACVLPALFPYLFITHVLTGLKTTRKLALKFAPFTMRFFNVGGAVGYAFFISLLSGYPVGAKIVSDLKNNGAISESESVRAAALCSTSSPMFLIGSVGNIMFNSSLFGALLFSCHLFSALSVGFIFSFYKKNEKSLPSLPRFSPKSENVLYDGTYNAVISVLVVGGLIALFYLFTEILLRFNLLSPLIFALDALIKDENLARGVVLGFFECTRGLKTIANVGLTPLSLPFCAFICGFGGLSVLFQSLAFLKKAKIKTAPFIFAKVISAVVNFLFALIASIFIC